MAHIQLLHSSANVDVSHGGVKMTRSGNENHNQAIPALKVNQWLQIWNEVPFSAKNLRSKPEDHFYLFSLPARDLRRLSGIYPRKAKGRTRSADDLGIQRRHDEDRSKEINEFVMYGHPWAGLSKAQRKSKDYGDLKKPGWLPTAIVVNILRKGDSRGGKKIADADLIRIEGTKSNAFVALPSGFSKPDWKASSIPPIEVIDGQHRLWAFDDTISEGEFELPVVAFRGLDISWQAYLFYTINIKPKRINASLAFDLYPLLRTEDWLEKFEGPIIYRENRAQELVDLLYSHPESPWHDRINMLGETGMGRMVSQSAWVRSLLATFVKKWEGQKISIGGLFGAPVGTHEQALPWSRHEQAAFLIVAGQCFQKAIGESNERWAKSLRNASLDTQKENDADLAFSGPNTLIAQDQGIRAFLSVVNDLCFLNSDLLHLEQWGQNTKSIGSDQELVSEAVRSLKKTSAYSFLNDLAKNLKTFDWRASSAPGLSNEQSLLRAAFRGSGGYKGLRHQLLMHLQASPGQVGTLATEAIQLLGYDE
jgi:DGQHR domain-containing protein